jgi:hypothetical protein
MTVSTACGGERWTRRGADIGTADSTLMWLDMTSPSKEPTFVVKPDPVALLTTSL